MITVQGAGGGGSSPFGLSNSCAILIKPSPSIPKRRGRKLIPVKVELLK